MFLITNLFSQSIKEINKNINIPDSLTYKNEIRIYKKISISNGTDIFRMYKDEKNKWNVKLYSYVSFTESSYKPEFKIQDLKSSTDLKLIWLYFLGSHLEYLPSINQINYKLQGEPSYTIEDGQYTVSHSMISINDGDEYVAFIRNGNIRNRIEFNNFESYLKEYPDVDELIFYAKIISLIKKEFNVWE